MPLVVALLILPPITAPAPAEGFPSVTLRSLQLSSETLWLPESSDFSFMGMSICEIEIIGKGLDYAAEFSRGITAADAYFVPDRSRVCSLKVENDDLAVSWIQLLNQGVESRQDFAVLSRKCDIVVRGNVADLVQTDETQRLRS